MFLLFKKKFHEAIRSGAKRQTIRVWKRCFLRAGQVTFTPGLGRVRITRVDAVRLEEITDQDAVADGFSGRGPLLAELDRLYGERLAAGGTCYKITFQFPADGETTAEK